MIPNGASDLKVYVSSSIRYEDPPVIYDCLSLWLGVAQNFQSDNLGKTKYLNPFKEQGKCFCGNILSKIYTYDA